MLAHPNVGQDSLPAAHAEAVTIGGDLVVNRMGFGAMRLPGPGITSHGD